MGRAYVASLLGRSAIAEFLAVGLASCGYVVAARLLAGVPRLLRWLGAAVAAMWLASFEFHLLSISRAFSLSGASAAVAISIGIVMWVGAGKRTIQWWWQRDRRFLRRLGRRIARSPHRSVVLLLTVLVGIVVAHSLLLPPLGWDSLTYHAVKAAMWVQHAGFVDVVAPGTWAVYRNYWAGAEVLTAWSMLPFHSDAMAMAMQAIHWLLVGVAIVTLARELGAREPYASSAGVLVLSIPTLRMQVGTGYVEVVGLMFLLSGTALAVRFLRRPEAGVMWLAAAALGLASGVKMTFLLPSLAVFAALIIRALGASCGSPARIAIALGAFVAGVAPWLWHAFQSTGAPLSPLALRLLGVEIGRSNPEIQAYFSRPVSPLTVAEELERLADALLRGYEGPGVPAVVAALVGLGSLPSLLRRRQSAALLILLVIVTSVLEYYSPDLSVIRRYSPSSSVRFALVPLALAAGLSATSFRHAPDWRRFYLWFLTAGALFDFGLYLLHSISARAAAGICALAATAAILGVAASAAWRIATSRSVRLALCAAGASLFLTVASLAHDRMRPELERMGFASAPIPPYWLHAAARVDEPSRPRRIAVTSGPWLMADNWFVYPFLGRRLQNDVVYVPVSSDGMIRHFGSTTINDEHLRTADFRQWLARIDHANVSEVMSFSPASVELAWMEDHPDRFRRLLGRDGDWGLFALEGRRVS